MQYIVFKDHPADLLRVRHSHDQIHTFLDVDKKNIKVTEIKYLGKNKFRLCGVFPTNKLERNSIIKTLTHMHAKGEIFEFRI